LINDKKKQFKKKNVSRPPSKTAVSRMVCHHSTSEHEPSVIDDIT
jgi:hypothetical protein